MLIDARFVALDTSHWRQWAADALSTDIVARTLAKDFYSRLGDAGYSILFTWHHLEELMAVGDASLASRRYAFIRDLPVLAWIGIVPEEAGLGAITDIMAAEVEAALQEGNLRVVRDAAKARLLRFGSGADMIVDHPAFLPFIQRHAQERVEKDRTITAIAPFEFLAPNIRVHDLMARDMRSEGEIRQALMLQFRALTDEIAKRGDRRIADAEKRAITFLSDMLEVRRSLPDTVRELILGGYGLCGIDADEIGPETTTGEMDNLMGFRGQLRVIAEKLGLSFETIKRRIQPERLPHKVIRDALQEHGQSRDRRPGSDLIDSYLAALGVYCDVLFVDRRTAEDFRRAQKHLPSLAGLLGRIVKASNYRDIPKLLS